LQVASGEALPDDQPEIRGHSIEVRLYAEDPAKNWQPQSGTVHHIELPGDPQEFSVLREQGVRLDSGVVDGSVVGVHYDPMLAKVISYAPTRTAAARLLASTLARTRIHGLRTNRDLLVNVLAHPAFIAGDTDTAFFETHDLEKLSTPLADTDAERLSALAAALADAAHNRASARVIGRLPSGWRNLPSQPQSKSYSTASGDYDVRYSLSRSGVLSAEGFDDVRLVSATATRVVLEQSGVQRSFDVAAYGSEIFVDSSLGPVALTAAPRFVDPSAEVAAGSLLAPMPGSVIRLGAALGDTVTAGQPILWLEAMKMEHTVTAPTAGVLVELPVAVGQQVEVGSVLARVEEPATEEEA